jgi:transcriptional regulator with XRE-family HTH domain
MMILSRLTALRKSRKWSLQDVADQLGIAKSTYAGYESGYRRPSLEAMKLMADLFDTSIDYLLGRTDEPIAPLHPPGSPGSVEITENGSDQWTIDGVPLSAEEARQFIAFIRAKRSIEAKD